MATVNTNLNSGIIRFTFTDSDGEVFAHFKMNPTDIRIKKRCEDAADRFKKLSEEAEESAPEKYEEELEKLFCDVLGYDVSECLFGFMSATTILPDGNLFARVVMDRIVDAIKPEMKKRVRAMQKAVSKHTAKYNK